MSSELVIDANMLVDALTDDGDHGTAARAALRDSTIAGPEHLWVETLHVLRALACRGTFDADTMGLAVEHLSRLPISVVPTALLLEWMWALRENLTGHDAAYVAAAEHLGVDLLTRDGALHAAPGTRHPVHGSRALTGTFVRYSRIRIRSGAVWRGLRRGGPPSQGGG